MTRAFFSASFPGFASLAALLVLGALALGCTPSIGDKCALSTDCSLQGERLCDTSQPGGYCTVLNCTGNLCPDKAACVLFHPNLQGCSYDDRHPSRTGRTFCMAQCSSDSDCRGGYVCADPRATPWNAVILDDDQGQRICIAAPGPTSSTPGGDTDPPVCQAAPDAGVIVTTPPDASAVDASEDGASDAAGTDASDAGAPDADDAG